MAYTAQFLNHPANSDTSIGEVAYGLGFEYPQHFSKLFKSKTGINPSAYRNVN